MANGLLAALDGTQSPLPRRAPDQPDELTEMVNLGVRTWNKEVEDLERSWRTNQYIREFRDYHGPELDRLQKPPSAKVLKRYEKAFDDFQRWARLDNMQGLPVHAAVVAAYLAVLMLAEKPMREIREAASAIEYYHKVSELFFDSDYVAITLKNAAEYAALNKGDAPKPNGHDTRPEEGTDNG
ncbi:MAG TPA: hypothetical protein VKG24_03450 [Pseudolabrys sp.]|nr:hypothetical protein [Pseudolabrys sp.]